MKADIMSVSRLRMATDGKGISTLVAFLGCPLQCKYCINPACHASDYELSENHKVWYSSEELLEVLQKDSIYYLMTGGGIVFGGGEPLMQSEFIHEVCKMADPRWARRIETSLNCPWSNIEPVLDDMDEWIIDVKDLNRDTYLKYTGADNNQMLTNLFYLAEKVPKEKIKIRVPVIKGFNTIDDAEDSALWLMESLDLEPEIFEYTV